MENRSRRRSRFLQQLSQLSQQSSQQAGSQAGSQHEGSQAGSQQAGSQQAGSQQAGSQQAGSQQPLWPSRRFSKPASACWALARTKPVTSKAGSIARFSMGRAPFRGRTSKTFARKSSLCIVAVATAIESLCPFRPMSAKGRVRLFRSVKMVEIFGRFRSSDPHNRHERCDSQRANHATTITVATRPAGHCFCAIIGHAGCGCRW